MELRPYQKEAKTAVLSQWEQGNSKTLLVLPTGCGKTIVFAKIAEDRVRNGERVLILAHRGELLEQAADKILNACGLGCAVEKAEESCIGSWYRITVGSVQSLMREKRLAQFSKDYFNTIIIDEAHHSISDSYQKILGYFDEAKVLGVTATPDRGDMKNLGQVFDSLAYEYTLPRAIKEGYLSPIKALTIPLKLDLTGVGTQAGDYKASDIDTALDPYLYQIADEMLKYCKERKTVVFLPLIKTSQKFCKILNEKGFRSAEVNGNSIDRGTVLADFDSGKYNVLCNSMLLTEGWDCPSVDCVIVLRPTKVRGLYCQMVGRGTRLCEGMLTGQRCFERDCVKADPVAHKEYLRLTKLLSTIQKNDALYGASINRYCELYSEVNAVKADAVTQRAVLSKIEIAFNNLSDEEITSDELMKFTKLMTGALAKIADLDKIIMQKRKMMSDIEKENGWTVLSAIRAIPKQAENSEDDALMKILQGGKNNGAV